MENKKTCCITGPFPENLPYGYDENDQNCIKFKSAIRAAIEDQIHGNHISRFITTVNIGVEMLAAEEVLRIKKNTPQVMLTSVLPFEGQANEWPEPLRDRYFSIHKQSDDVHSVQLRFDDTCAYNTRDYLTDRADVLLAFWDGKPGEIESIVQLAKQKAKQVIVYNI